ncbi:MAG: hypothetical protein GYA23_10580 [Methanomicrobiales archaeon]|nr:hypothetical protein [Methanomicrobiales archaeon]
MKVSTVIIFIAAFVALALAVPAVQAIDPPSVTITDYTVSPSVLLPDSQGTITITVKNTASTSSISEKSGQLSTDVYALVKTTDTSVNIENVQLEGNGIKVVSDKFARVGAIGPGQSLTFKFTIESPHASGMYYPEVWIDTTGGKSTRYPIPVNVNTALGIQKTAILIMDSTLTGSQNPGDEIPVTILVTNSGQMMADDVTLKIENVTSMVAPKNTDLYHLGMIPAGEQRSVNLVLLSDKKMNAGLVKIPVSLRYNGMDGSAQTQFSNIDILFKGKAELGFVTVDTSPSRLTEGTPFDLTVRIENTGTGEAKQVSATIDLPVEGKKEAFIGKIKPGNDAPAIFLLEGAKAGTIPYTITIKYTDDMGEHTMTRQMNLRVPPTDNSGLLLFGLIVLVLIAFLGYRYWYLPKVNGDGKFSWERKS